jgi:hypothetical protein
MTDQGDAPALEQLREELRKDVRDEVRSALREFRETSGATANFDGLGPLGSRCFIIIAVPVGCSEETGVQRFRRMEGTASEQ